MPKIRTISGFTEALLPEIQVKNKKAARLCLKMAYEYIIAKSRPFCILAKTGDFLNAGKVLAQLLFIMREEPFNYVATYLKSRKKFPDNIVATLALRENMQPLPEDEDSIYSINLLIQMHKQNNGTESNLLTVMLKDKEYMQIRKFWKRIKNSDPANDK